MAIEQVKQELNELKSIEALKRCGIQTNDTKGLRVQYAIALASDMLLNILDDETTADKPSF